MKKETKKNIQELKAKARLLLWWGGEHAFTLSVALLALSFLFAALVFWQYGFKLQGEDVADQQAEAQFKQEAFNEALFQLEQDEQRFEKADELSPRDIFYAD